MLSADGATRPAPSKALAARLAEGVDLIGIVHWGLNTYTDREWGYGNEDPALLNPAKLDADQIVGACKAGGLKGLVIVAKHHDGFCLWPTKTTEHNITKTPFWKGTGNVSPELSGIPDNSAYQEIRIIRKSSSGRAAPFSAVCDGKPCFIG